MNAIALYRLGHWAHKRNIPLVPKLADALIRILFNCVVYSSTDIGKGTTLAYGGIAVVIHKRARIGNDVLISQCVTIGGRSGITDLPVIGDSVYIGAGAKILGNISIGDGAVIGANAVVISNVAPGDTVAGVPAKSVARKAQREIDAR